MTPDSTHDIAPVTPARPGLDPVKEPALDAVVERPAKPSASDRVAGETAPVQIQPAGR